MICPNCRNQVVDEADSCGTNIKELKENNIQPITSQSNYTFQQFDNNVKNLENKKHSSKSTLIIILIIIMIIIVGLCCIGFNYFSKQQNVENNNGNDEVKEDFYPYSNNRIFHSICRRCTKSARRRNLLWQQIPRTFHERWFALP